MHLCGKLNLSSPLVAINNRALQQRRLSWTFVCSRVSVTWHLKGSTQLRCSLDQLFWWCRGDDGWHGSQCANVLHTLTVCLGRLFNNLTHMIWTRRGRATGRGSVSTEATFSNFRRNLENPKLCVLTTLLWRSSNHKSQFLLCVCVQCSSFSSKQQTWSEAPRLIFISLSTSLQKFHRKKLPLIHYSQPVCPLWKLFNQFFNFTREECVLKLMKDFSLPSESLAICERASVNANRWIL